MGVIILLGPQYEIKLCDFGGSKSELTEHSNYGCPGTLRYTAPEVFAGEKKYTYASDVYSTGLVLWECIERRCVCRVPDDRASSKTALQEAKNLKEAPFYIFYKQLAFPPYEILPEESCHEASHISDASGSSIPGCFLPDGYVGWAEDETLRLVLGARTTFQDVEELKQAVIEHANDLSKGGIPNALEVTKKLIFYESHEAGINHFKKHANALSLLLPKSAFGTSIKRFAEEALAFYDEKKKLGNEAEKSEAESAFSKRATDNILDQLRHTTNTSSPLLCPGITQLGNIRCATMDDLWKMLIKCNCR
ncbi:unnamed protein product, partial [Mesorhabditis spiculigera]